MRWRSTLKLLQILGSFVTGARRWLITNWQFCGGLLVLLGVAYGSFALTQSFWSIALTLWLAIAVVFLMHSLYPISYTHEESVNRVYWIVILALAVLAGAAAALMELKDTQSRLAKVLTPTSVSTSTRLPSPTSTPAPAPAPAEKGPLVLTDTPPSPALALTPTPTLSSTSPGMTANTQTPTSTTYPPDEPGIPTSTTAPPLTFTSTPTPTLSPTLTPTGTLSPTSKGALTYTPTPSETQKPAVVPPKTSSGVGKLLVQASVEGCDREDFAAKWGEGTTSGYVGEERELAAGVYDVILNSDFGNPPVREDILVPKDQTRVVDFTQDLGTLRLEGYPEYIISPGDATWSSGNKLCGPTGTYEITLATHRRSCSSFCGIPGGCCTSYYYALFPTKIEFNVEVKVGETTIVSPEDWPQQLGRFMFEPSHIPGNVLVEDLQNGTQFDGNLNESVASGYWMFAGKYRLTMLEQPHTGTEYEFEIKAGKITTLQWPSTP